MAVEIQNFGRLIHEGLTFVNPKILDTVAGGNQNRAMRASGAVDQR